MFDFVGLRSLTIIDWAVKAVNSRDSGLGIGDSEKRGSSSSNPESPIPNPVAGLDITPIPLDDPATYALFARGETVAVFPFASRGMPELLTRAPPDQIGRASCRERGGKDEYIAGVAG